VDRVAGLAGCNNYFAGYEVTGETLAISELGMTMMVCPEPAMELEKAFASALVTVESYRAAGGMLEIFCADGSLIFNTN
jgi:heat shock protein HslJ